MDAARTLSEFEDAHYRAAVLDMGTVDAVDDRFREMAAKYPELLDAARVRLTALEQMHSDANGKLGDRCFISSKAHEFLSRVCGS
jgi:hypothetical protein